MGEPLSPDRVFDFPEEKLEPHPAYDFFAPELLPGYAVDMEEEQMATPVMDMEEDLVALFGEDDDFSDDDSERVEEEKVWKVNEEWLMAPITPPSVLAVRSPSVYEDLSTRLGNLEYRHGQLVKKVIQISDSEVATGVSITEIDLKVFAIEGQVQVMAFQMVHATDRWEQVGAQIEQGQQTATQRYETIAELTQQVQILQAVVQQRDVQIQQLHIMV
nr:hypothetical protein [Tanacetum cinerariifolium]